MSTITLTEALDEAEFYYPNRYELPRGKYRYQGRVVREVTCSGSAAMLYVYGQTNPYQVDGNTRLEVKE